MSAKFSHLHYFRQREIPPSSTSLRPLLFALALGTCGLFGQGPEEAAMHHPSPAEQTSLERGDGPSFEEQVVEIVNQERWTNGQRPPLKHNAILDQSSETHSVNMATRDFFAHCDLDTGTSAGQRMTQAGYTWNAWGENIAAGQQTPASVMNGWMNSQGHRNNILSETYREIGVGYAFQTGDGNNVRLDSDGNCSADGTSGPFFHYWTQNFGRNGSTYPVVINREAYETELTAVELYVYGSGEFTEMRFRNDGGTWSDWEPFSTDVNWILNAVNGVREVDAELRRGNGSTVQASDTIVLTQACVTEAAWWGQVAAWPVPNVTSVLTLMQMQDNLCEVAF
ncbi:SCP domain-containing protein [Sulfidibacter corallicola]|uniref:SCP domain-containing protein n=1 Tax=Sulfidibacter corallicola TaxID=2818388 RepID=A0A8A4TPD3_SULCO|nr:CAP domain-containing protein [Sulfidibacter corallicola]QTD50761.1 hypothetical protein J3U87_34690 [Sulfidibacter corallicola]